MARSIFSRTLVNGLIWSFSLAFFSCQPQTPVAEAQGDLKVMIPMVAQNRGAIPNPLETVTIKNITSLKNVSGSYVQFYYTPGSSAGSLTGVAPQAKFIRTNDNVYVPSDSLTQQMFSLYYHVQKLNDFNAEISPELKQTRPFQIGLNTQVEGNASTGKNNAFYDGGSNALLVVPYTLENIPISVNSGIIAHEFFHSIFFKQVLANFGIQQDALLKSAPNKNEALKVFYFNQTYIRGLNEGLADYWGWLYTDNSDFISASLPKFGHDRKIELTESLIGKTETDSDIEDQVSQAQELSKKPTEYLSSYIYQIGTPHARFLKMLTQKIAVENKSSETLAKLAMAKAIYSYLKHLSVTTSTFKINDAVEVDDLFKFFAQPELSGMNLSTDQCDFVLKYINTKEKSLKGKLCQGTGKDE